MLSADRLREFQVVVESASITAAARNLGIPRATLSRRMSNLERELAVRLMQRTTRNLVLTPAGDELYRRACRVVADTAAAWSAVRRLDETPRGPLRVAVPSNDLAVSDFYLGFAETYPEVRMEIVVTKRAVDLVSEGIDVALCFGPVESPGLLVRRFFNSKEVAVASPNYLARRGRPRTTEELKEHDCIVFFEGDRVTPTRWKRQGRAPLSIAPYLTTNNFYLMITAALRGLGIGLIDSAAIQNHLDAGTLIEILPGEFDSDSSASLVFVEREYQLPQVRAFIDHALAYYQELFSIYSCAPPVEAFTRNK